MMSEKEKELANEYMNYLFNSKKPVKTRTRTVFIWEQEGHVNWLAFNLAMFKYFDTDEFSEEQRQLIKSFQKSVEGKDGHTPHYDYYGNTLKNMHGVLKKFNT